MTGIHPATVPKARLIESRSATIPSSASTGVCGEVESSFSDFSNFAESLQEGITHTLKVPINHKVSLPKHALERTADTPGAIGQTYTTSVSGSLPAGKSALDA